MDIPSIENRSGFEFLALGLENEEGHPVMVSVVKATYSIIPNRREVVLSERQIPVNASGEFWGDPETSSYKYEPEVSFPKPGTDVILIGSAYARRSDTKEVDVVLKIGSITKMVRVIGDRFWYKSLGIINMTAPVPFERIPLLWENAFGGWDRTHPDPSNHTFEPRNPVGTGFRKSWTNPKEKVKLPNLENPQDRLIKYTDQPTPAGFGFVSPNWEPRRKLAGTYDQAWLKSRMPLLPLDFSPRFYNAAPEDQVTLNHLLGNERVLVVNASKGGTVEFQLPGIRPPHCLMSLRNCDDRIIETVLDTVIINTDDNLLFLLWRGHLVLREGPQEVLAIKVSTEDLSGKIDKNRMNTVEDSKD